MSHNGIDRGVKFEIEGRALNKLAHASQWLLGLARRAPPDGQALLDPAESERIRHLTLIERIINLIEEMRHELAGMLGPDQRLVIELPCEQSGDCAIALCGTSGHRVFISDFAISNVPIIP
ncbi:MAG: hypothetical protein ACKOVA_09965 [Novosphingobium sp.]